jgi:hypothetical protein
VIRHRRSGGTTRSGSGHNDRKLARRAGMQRRIARHPGKTQATASRTRSRRRPSSRFGWGGGAGRVAGVLEQLTPSDGKYPVAKPSRRWATQSRARIRPKTPTKDGKSTTGTPRTLTRPPTRAQITPRRKEKTPFLPLTPIIPRRPVTRGWAGSKRKSLAVTYS